MTIEAYRWLADISKPSGQHIAQTELDIDFAPLAECAFLAGLRANSLTAVKYSGMAEIEPIWDIETHKPYVMGINVTVNSNDRLYSHRINTVENGLFRSAVLRVSSGLVKRGELIDGEKFNYRILAISKPSPQRVDNDFELKAIEEPLAINNAVSLNSLMDKSIRHGVASWHKEDIPVFFSERVVSEARVLGEKSGESESGGILLGHLCRDNDNLFIVIRAFIEAQYTEAKSMSLTFTADTWKAVQITLDLRDQDERIMGWSHSHPVFAWCKRCDEARRSICPLQKPFFSDSDINVQRTVFSSAFMIAMLFSFLSQRTSVDLFGWRDGQVVPRGYYVVSDNVMTAI